MKDVPRYCYVYVLCSVAEHQFNVNFNERFARAAALAK
jgi:hypothetical protein